MKRYSRIRFLSALRVAVGVTAVTVFCRTGLAQNAPIPVPPAQLGAVADAKESFDRGDFIKAEAAYLQILKAIPDNVHVLSSLGQTELRLQKYAPAEQILQRALKIDTRNVPCLEMLGTVYYYQRRFDDAMRVFTRVFVLAPDNETARDYTRLIATRKEIGTGPVAEVGIAIANNGGKDPSDVFLRAYLSFKKAEALAKNGAIAAAIQAYKAADETLADLAKENPNWNSSIVKFRREAITKAIDQLKP